MVLELFFKKLKDMFSSLKSQKITTILVKMYVNIYFF